MDSREFDGFALVDRERSACLCDVGSAGYVLAVAVTDDGRDTFWIVDESELHAEQPGHGNANQPHEQLGRLPERWRERVAWAAPFRCDRPTKGTGAPCRIPVGHAGAACAFHRAKSEADRQTAP